MTESFEVKCPNGHLFSMTKLQLIKLARDSGAVFLLPRSSLVMPRSSRVHRADAHSRQGS